MKFKNETDKKVAYYGIDRNGNRKWIVLGIGEEANIPKDKGLALGLTQTGADEPTTPLVIKKSGDTTSDSVMRLGKTGPIVPPMPEEKPKTVEEVAKELKPAEKPVEEPKPEEEPVEEPKAEEYIPQPDKPVGDDLKKAPKPKKTKKKSKKKVLKKK